jgi:hypothetical protein
MSKPNFTQKIFCLQYPDGEKVQLRVYIASEVDLYVKNAEETINNLRKMKTVNLPKLTEDDNQH